MKSQVNRRRFLQGTAVGAGYFFTANALSAARAADGPNSKVRFAGIGVGGKGGGDITQAAGLGIVTAICDVDENSLNRKANEKDRDSGQQHFLSAKKYFDYRKMLDEMGKEIDAVTVGTPDHTHAPASVMAMKMKKHVYTQKPLTHTVFEARRMREIAKEMGVATQMGNQGSASGGLRKSVEIVQAGVLGAIKEAHVWTNRPIWPQGHDAILQVPAAREAALAALHGRSGSSKSSDAPKNVHWDLFLGPAPERPYAAAYHPFAWRGWLDFGTGALGDMACHTMNMPFRALKLGFPTSVVASDTREVNSETYPTQAKVTYQFPAREGMPPCTLTWYEGQYRGQKALPDQRLLNKVLQPYERPANSGSLLVGEKGILYAPDDNGTSRRLVGEGLEEAAKAVPEKLPRHGQAGGRRGDGGDPQMKAEWVEAMKGGPPAYSNFDFAGMLTETILLGNVAMRLSGKKLEWDGPSLKFTNNSDANQYLHFDYRKGWTL
jgi:predicted dehydrogenase